MSVTIGSSQCVIMIFVTFLAARSAQTDVGRSGLRQLPEPQAKERLLVPNTNRSGFWAAARSAGETAVNLMARSVVDGVSAAGEGVLVTAGAAATRATDSVKSANLSKVAYYSPGESLLDASQKAGETVSSAAKATSDAIRNVTGAFIPFETKYYTDYFHGGHKLYREVTSTSNGKVVHCTYVGDREIIAALVGDRQAAGLLADMLPTSTVSPLFNETTAQLDDRIDACVDTAAEHDDTQKVGLKQFIDKLTNGFKDLGKYIFIFPGTKWCGPGDVARNESDLGPQKETDMCCRSHDHADKSIPRGKTLYGLRNPLFYTITGCGHDDNFRRCLANNNLAHSSAVGTVFFNILKTQCFDKRKQAHCVKKLPFAPCQKYIYDEDTEEQWQIFDPVAYVANNSSRVGKALNRVLHHTPGIDNLLDLVS